MNHYPRYFEQEDLIAYVRNYIDKILLLDSRYGTVLNAPVCIGIESVLMEDLAFKAKAVINEMTIRDYTLTTGDTPIVDSTGNKCMLLWFAKLN